MKVIGVYAGSFDPITSGHMEIVESALKLVDQVLIVKAINPSKKSVFDNNNMELAINEMLERKGLL